MSLSPAVLGEPGAGPGVKRPLDTDHESGVRSGEHKKHKQDLASLPTRQYLDQTVVPILLQVCNIIISLKALVEGGRSVISHMDS